MRPNPESSKTESSKKYYLNSSYFENSEGGLNLIEFQNVIQRKLPLILGIALSLTSLALIKILTSPPIYVAGFELLSEPVNIETKVTSSDDESRKTREEISSVELDEVQLKILKSPRLISRAVKSLQDRYPKLNYQELTKDLSINIINNNNEQNILKVVYENPNQQRVTDVIETLTKTYIDYSVEKRQSGVKRGIAFLDRQIPRLSSQANDVEKQMSELRGKYNFVDPGVLIQQTNDSINNLVQERAKNKIELEELRSMLNDLERELEIQPNRSTTAIKLGTPRFLQLQDRLREIDVEIGRKSAIFSDNSIEIQALNAERQEILALLKEAGDDTAQKLKNRITILENRQRTITEDIANFQSELKQWSTISADFSIFRQKLNRINRQLNEFTLQKDSLLIDAAQQDAPWQLLTPAGEPVTSNIGTINYLLLSSTLGVLLGVAIALALDKYENIIYTTYKVEELTDLPILGAIAYSSNPSKLSFGKSLDLKKEIKKLPSHPMAIGDQKPSGLNLRTPSIETFRSFAANLGILNFSSNSESLNSHSEIKSLVVTSAIPKEGKSTVALNLAKASASMGKRVLIVDADLRNAERLTKSLGFNNEIGLKNLLSQEDPSLNIDCIKELPLEKNLYILGSGFDDANIVSEEIDPSRLLASTKMNLLMDLLKTKFDLVIYDLCSTIGFADVNLLAANTDGIIFVTGLSKVRTTSLTEALNQLELCQAPVLGIAVNNLKK